MVLKSFAEGVNLLTSKSIEKNFMIFRIGEERSSLSLFKNKYYLYSEEFSFGSNPPFKIYQKYVH